MFAGRDSVWTQHQLYSDVWLGLESFIPDIPSFVFYGILSGNAIVPKSLPPFEIRINENNVLQALRMVWLYAGLKFRSQKMFRAHRYEFQTKLPCTLHKHHSWNILLEGRIAPHYQTESSRVGKEFYLYLRNDKYKLSQWPFGQILALRDVLHDLYHTELLLLRVIFPICGAAECYLWLEQ